MSAKKKKKTWIKHHSLKIVDFKNKNLLFSLKTFIQICIFLAFSKFTYTFKKIFIIINLVDVLCRFFVVDRMLFEKKNPYVLFKKKGKQKFKQLLHFLNKRWYFRDESAIRVADVLLMDDLKWNIYIDKVQYLLLTQRFCCPIKVQIPVLKIVWWLKFIVGN